MGNGSKNGSNVKCIASYSKMIGRQVHAHYRILLSVRLPGGEVDSGGGGGGGGYTPYAPF